MHSGGPRKQTSFCKYTICVFKTNTSSYWCFHIEHSNHNLVVVNYCLTYLPMYIMFTASNPVFADYKKKLADRTIDPNDLNIQEVIGKGENPILNVLLCVASNWPSS